MSADETSSVCEVCGDSNAQQFHYYYGFAQNEVVGRDSNGNVRREVFYYDMEEGSGYMCERDVLEHWEMRKNRSQLFLIVSAVILLVGAVLYLTASGGGTVLAIIGGIMTLIGIVWFISVRRESYDEIGSNAIIDLHNDDQGLYGYNAFLVPHQFEYERRIGRAFLSGEAAMIMGARYLFDRTAATLDMSLGRRSRGGRTGSRGGSRGGSRSGPRRSRR